MDEELVVPPVEIPGLTGRWYFSTGKPAGTPDPDGKEDCRACAVHVQEKKSSRLKKLGRAVAGVLQRLSENGELCRILQTVPAVEVRSGC